MRIAIVSDIHANGDALDAVVRELSRRRPDRVYHLGDLTGYNAEPERCVRWAMERCAGGVAGNHDAVAAGLDTGDNFNPPARRAAIWTRSMLSAESAAYLAGLPARREAEGGSILLLHGAISGRDRYLFGAHDARDELDLLPRVSAARIAFFGHTHVAGGFVRRSGGAVEEVPPDRFRPGPGETALLNPGSVGQPRDRDPRASFLLYDTDDPLATWVRVPYDIGACRRRILSAGLPGVLAGRLEEGA